MRSPTGKRSRAGFTLAEMLITMLILLMMTAVVAAGMPAAVGAYKKVIDASNARILLSTTVTELRAELSTAMEVELDGALNVTHYSNGERGQWSNLVNSDDGIKVIRTSRSGEKTPTVTEGESESPEPALLVTNKAANENLCASFESITYIRDSDTGDDTGGCFKVSGLKVSRGGESPITDAMDLMIRAILAPTITTAAP